MSCYAGIGHSGNPSRDWAECNKEQRELLRRQRIEQQQNAFDQQRLRIEEDRLRLEEQRYNDEVRERDHRITFAQEKVADESRIRAQTEDKQAEEKSRIREQAIAESHRLHVLGNFKGWNGYNHIVLSDGSLYDEIEFHVYVVEATNPSVTVTGDSKGSLMYVQGSDRAVRVRKVN